jgi:hypothetical protein
LTKTLVIHPTISTREKAERSLHASLEEAVGLAHAIELTVNHAAIVRLQKVTPATYIGLIDHPPVVQGRKRIPPRFILNFAPVLSGSCRS